MSPDRDPRVLNDPALKVAPGMLEAFDAAGLLAVDRPNVTVRIIDADVLLEIARAMTTPGVPKPLPWKAPRNVVEVFIDPSGVLVVGTGRDSRHPAYRAVIVLPVPDDAVSVHAFEGTLAFHVTAAGRAIRAQSESDLFGTASP